ncbi:FKBP-type peptidyl-prolyl cis-trans isomerase [Thiohalobacter thiocyanaticus]|uniref:peptidylprolyl isomerase n=1 Tax=Thiohalobacter thiocyanaticus TaxID=585455 RepID=A0A426QJR6_9GAMM|nr:FKBP-type peptidyl-prolyl cis-trans isomerase [Thiohalobacter thiocyanaticus]RRQ21947.1 peptidylprolyl isomerase [Thiohalobacter thiocyanaticus]
MSEKCIAPNTLVAITYSIKDEEGNLLEHSDMPISYIHGGRSDLFEKIEAALEGKRVGETVEVSLTPEESFGEYDPSLTFTDDLDNVPEQYRNLGAEVEMRSDQGESRMFYVTKIENGRLTVDGNHPFAGKNLVFSVKVEHIRDATAEDIVAAGEGGQSTVH